MPQCRRATTRDRRGCARRDRRGSRRVCRSSSSSRPGAPGAPEWCGYRNPLRAGASRKSVEKCDSSRAARCRDRRRRSAARAGPPSRASGGGARLVSAGSVLMCSAGKTYCQPQSRSAPGYLRAIASGRKTPPKPRARSSGWMRRTRESQFGRAARTTAGKGTTRSRLPLVSRTRMRLLPNSTSLTRRRRASSRRMPVP